MSAKNINKWVGYHFESSCYLTPEFAEFAKQVSSCLKKIEGYELVDFLRGHFYFSAFLKNIETGKLVYISCFDVRHFPDRWYYGLLIRTASHKKDFTGGSNNFIKFTKIKEMASQLTQ